MGFWADSRISWIIREQSAPRSRQITTPTPHHSIYTGRMLFLRPTNSVKALKVFRSILTLWKFSHSDYLPDSKNSSTSKQQQTQAVLVSIAVAKGIFKTAVVET